VLTIGVGSCLFVALVILPSILTLISNARRDHQDEESQGHREPEAIAVPPQQRPRELSIFYPPETAA
jgi:predicted RND superfamily exporter protein